MWTPRTPTIRTVTGSCSAPMLYRNLIGKGFLPPESMNTLRQTGSSLQGHPCMRTPGVDMPSGPLGIGLAAAAFTFAVGGGLGILAGFAGGWADALISFLIQVLLAIPQLPVMIVIGAFLGQSTWNLVWIIAAFSWAPVARQMRAKTISIRRRDYVQMARLYGGGTWYLIRTHIGHELWTLLTINALAVVGRAILQESSLAFLGLSDPLARSWGMMIARAVDFPGLYRTDFWTWWLLPPVGALVLSTLLLRLLVGGLEEQQRRDKPCCWK